MVACEQVGRAERILEMSVGYAGTRVQFGRPIGSFQAVSHALADMEAIRVYGGIGFTWEHDAHLYFRRAWTCAYHLTCAQTRRRSAMRWRNGSRGTGPAGCPA